MTAFLERVDVNNNKYISNVAFIQRFWAAYTYDDVFSDESAKVEEKDKQNKKKL